MFTYNLYMYMCIHMYISYIFTHILIYKHVCVQIKNLIAQLSHIKLMARSGGKQFVMVFEQFFKRLVVKVDKFFQLLKCMSY